MPPSPLLRRSPAKETGHKRGCSFESALPAKTKDVELTLFTDMQKSERENFLLEPSEDFDESISKLRYFPEFKLGVNIPTRGESHDLLNVDGEKNDYDWLLTPPETPLFRSLDDEEHQPIVQAHRGRAYSKPISSYRSSTMENAQWSSRSSASPSRLSPSPRSSSSAALSRARSSTSASRCSPPPVIRASTPPQRSSTPPAAKPLTPTRRSPSPASRRMSTGSGGPTSYGTRGTSPVKTNRGASSSPKLRGWQSNIPGFSLDAPPNLRTSLPDRSVSRSRGTSPSSLGGLDMASRGRRQSMSPTPSRSASSSHSNERDRFSSYSKTSVASSGEDDMDSIHCVPNGYCSNPSVRKNLTVMKSRTIASSKKPSKSFSPSSAPKRSFDSALWLMDHRKAPQNMFRPLLSSVPATTFGVGKGNNVQRPVFSRNSSLTTSSNASSVHGATAGPYMDSDHEQHDLVGEWETADGSDAHEDIFMFDKLDGLNAGTSSRVKCAESMRQELGKERTSTANQTSYSGATGSEVGYGEMATCPQCGKLFDIMEVDGGVDLCEDCASRDEDFSAELKTHTVQEEAHRWDIENTSCKPCVILEPPAALACIEDSRVSSCGHQLMNNESPADCLQRDPSTQLIVHRTEEILKQQVNNHAENARPHDVGGSALETYNDISLSSVSECPQKQPTSMMEHDCFRDQMDNLTNGVSESLSGPDCQGNALVSETRSGDISHQLGSIARPGLKVENSEGAGISVLLLQKSNSNKWPVVEGRALAATNILCSEPYYTRDNINVMKHSFGRESSSASSSIDLGLSRQPDGRFQRLVSSRRGDVEKAQLSSTVSGHSTASVSDMSISSSSLPLCPQSDTNEDFCYPIDSLESSASKMATSTEEHNDSCRHASSAMEYSSAERHIVNDDTLIHLNTSLDRVSEPAGDEVVIQNHNMAKIPDVHNSNTEMCLLDIEVPSNSTQSSAAVEGCILKAEDDASGVTHCYSISISEHPVDENSFENIQTKSEEVQVTNEVDKLDNCCVSTISEEDVLVCATGTNGMGLPNDESPATEGSRKQMQRSFTLEEATDTILFCSSIIHDLAYKAATIGMEHEQGSELAEAPRPTVTIVGKSVPRADGLPKLPHKRMPNRKVKRKRLEGETIIQSGETEEVSKGPLPVCSASELTKTSDSMKPPKLESKCNCTIM